LEADSSDDSVDFINDSEEESDYEEDGFVVSDDNAEYISSDDVNDEMSKLKEALSRSSEKDIQFSNKYLDELSKEQKTLYLEKKS